MAEWVYVENNQIKEYHGSLPSSWKNISGLNKADNVYLKTLGWLKVEKNHQSFNDSTHKSDGYDYIIQEDRVVETIKIVALTEQEIREKTQKNKEEFFTYLREERNRRLSDSDWTQSLDLQEIKTLEWINRWKQYRQALRDLPVTYENTTNYDISSITWPEVEK